MLASFIAGRLTVRQDIIINDDNKNILDSIISSNESIIDSLANEIVSKESIIDSLFLLKSQVKEISIKRDKEIRELKIDSGASLLMKNIEDYEKDYNTTVNAL